MIARASDKSCCAIVTVTSDLPFPILIAAAIKLRLIMQERVSARLFIASDHMLMLFTESPIYSFVKNRMRLTAIPTDSAVRTAFFFLTIPHQSSNLYFVS